MQHPYDGLPDDARFIPVIGKRPVGMAWNSDPDQWLTAEQAKTSRSNGTQFTGTGLLTGTQNGKLLWLDFDGEEVNESGEIISSATLDFEHFFFKHVDALPPCPINISGRTGRFRALMKMPEEWTGYFRGFSITSSESPTKSFEVLYEKSGGKSFHAVIEGAHPGGNGWHYRWRDGCSPKDIPIPEIPSWIIAGLVRHMAQKAVIRTEREQKATETDSDGHTMDTLSPGKQRKVIHSMQKFLPFRGGERNTGWAGHWDIMRRVVLSLYKGVDDEETFCEWLVDSDWDNKNDWDGAQGLSQPVNGGSLLTFARSLMRSETDGEIVRPFRSAWFYALENGWKPPAYAKPPRDIDTNSLSVDSAKLVIQLQKGLEQIDLIDTPAQRLAAQQDLASKIGRSGRDMAQLLQAIEEGPESYEAVSAKELLSRKSTVKPCINGLLAKGCLTLVASEGGGAKTSFCYRLAGAVATGGLFAERMQAIKDSVLIIQKDETEINARQKLNMMDWDRMPEEVLEKRLTFRFGWHPGMFPELKNWIKETKPGLVIMDSLGTLLGGAGSSLNDAEVALYIYRINKIASEMDTAIVLTHHTRKTQTDRKKSGEEEDGKRRRAKKSDLYGSSYILNAASDVWTLTNDGGDSDHPVFALEVLKVRSGMTQTNDLIHFEGNLDNLSFQFSSLNCMNEKSSADVLSGTTERKALEQIKLRTTENPITEKELMVRCNTSESTARRVVRALYNQKKLHGIDRRKLSLSEEPSSLIDSAGKKGRKTFGYFLN